MCDCVFVSENVVFGWCFLWVGKLGVVNVLVGWGC